VVVVLMPRLRHFSLPSVTADGSGGRGWGLASEQARGPSGGCLLAWFASAGPGLAVCLSFLPTVERASRDRTSTFSRYCIRQAGLDVPNCLGRLQSG
jgi:hypothetical protein